MCAPDDDDEEAAIPPPDQMQVLPLAPGIALIEIPSPDPIVPTCLTEAERQVAVMVFEGASNRDIAIARGVSVKTIANQLAAIYDKLGVTSRVELVLYLKDPPTKPQ